MSKVPLKNVKGDNIGDYLVSDTLIVKGKGDQAVHEAVVAYQTNQRTGAACTLTKSFVSGSGKKPWKQKGLGRARAGYKQSPVWRGGAVSHGPQPRDYTKKLTKKAAKLAFRRAFSDKVEQGDITVIDELPLIAPKTREFAAVLKNLNLTRGALFIVAEAKDNQLLASRNIPQVELVTSKLVNTYQILRYKNIIVTKAGMEALVQRLA